MFSPSALIIQILLTSVAVAVHTSRALMMRSQGVLNLALHALADASVVPTRNTPLNLSANRELAIVSNTSQGLGGEFTFTRRSKCQSVSKLPRPHVPTSSCSGPISNSDCTLTQELLQIERRPFTVFLFCRESSRKMGEPQYCYLEVLSA